MDVARLARLAEAMAAERDGALARLRAARAAEIGLQSALDGLAAEDRLRASCTDPALRAAGDAAWLRFSGAERRRLNTLLAAARADTAAAREAATRSLGRADAAAGLLGRMRSAQAARRAAASAVLAENVEHQDIADIGPDEPPGGLA